jgi:hypothetical protein
MSALDRPFPSSLSPSLIDSMDGVDAQSAAAAAAHHPLPSSRLV